MVSFEDPVTDTTYDPIGNPGGTAWKFIMMVGGLTMTLLAVGIANNNVLPWITNTFSNLTGTDVGDGSVGLGTNGGGL
jgi:hypothetical protein